MNTALKEARETNLWLRLIRDSELIKNEKLKIKDETEKELESLIQESLEIKNILATIVKSSRKK